MKNFNIYNLAVAPAVAVLALAIVLPQACRAAPEAATMNAAAVAAPSPDELLASGPTEAELVRYAYEHNPSVAAARERWRATSERYRAVTGMPDPQLMVTYFPEPIETRLGPQDWNMTLTQPLPLPGELGRAGAVAGAMGAMERVKLDKTVRDLAVEVRKSAHELWYERSAIGVARKQLELVEHLGLVATDEAAADRAALSDALKAQSQLGQVRYDLLVLEELEATELARLNSLLGRMPDAPVGPLKIGQAHKVELTLEQMVDAAVANRDEIRMAEAAVKVADAKLAKTRYDNYPNMKVGLFYASIGEPDVPTPPPNAGDDAIGIQFGISIPFWWNKNAGRTGEVEAELASARSERLDRMNKTRAMVHTLYFRLNNSGRLVALYRDDLLPQASRAMESAEVWFKQGEGSYSDFAETQSAYYNFRLSELRARADYGKTYAELEAAVGRSLSEPLEEAAPAESAPGAPAEEGRGSDD